MKTIPKTLRFVALTAMMALTALMTNQGEAQLYINELMFDPPGSGGDLTDEYIELRGDANASLENHYLIFIENELDEFGTGDAGVIEHIFDLGNYSLGSNGFFTIQQKNARYAADQISPLSTNVINTGPDRNAFPTAPGFGVGDNSTVGSSNLNEDGKLENSGFTAMLIRNDTGVAPDLGVDLDMGNDGLDMPTGQAGWTILDSIGVFSEDSETEFGRLYGQVNFGSNKDGIVDPETFVPKVEPGAEFILLDYEIEHLARWGSSTGQTADDWHATNVTDKLGAGYQGGGDYRQAGDPHPASDGDINTPAPQPGFIETNKGVPYGVKILDNIGAPNYITGDFNGDGIVDTADYTVWRQSVGQTGTELARLAADANHDFVVDEADYKLWRANFGTPASAVSPSPGFGASLSGAAVPEPATLGLVACMVVLGLSSMRQRN